MSGVRASGAAALFLLSVVLGVDQANACACCTDPGQRYVESVPIGTFERGELDGVVFAETAMLFQSPGFPDDVRGVKEPSGEDYRVSGGIAARRVSFEFTDKAGRSGKIDFALPARVTRFEVDPREETEATGGNGPALYKEWRLTGRPKLSGILRVRGAPQATLILHGRGNSCTSSSDFNKWTLVVYGGGANYKFLGALKR